MIHVGEQKVEHSSISFIDYNAETLTQEKDVTLESCLRIKDSPTVSWINLDGIHDIAEVEAFGKAFDLHLLEQEKQRYATLQQRLASYGPVENWYFDRQLEVSLQLKALNVDLDELQQRISNQLKETDLLHSNWQGRNVFGKNWKKHLQQADVKLPTDIFKRTQQQISVILALAEKNNQPLVELQKQVSKLQEVAQEQIGQVETGLKLLRKNLLRRNGHPLTNSSYWGQFTPELLTSVRQELGISLQLQKDFYSQSALLICIQILCAITVTGLIYRYRSVIAQSSRWQILRDHALATGLFAAVVFLSLLYEGMPPLFRLVLASLGLLSAVQLLFDLLKIRAISFYLYSFSFLTLLTLALRLAGGDVPENWV